MLSKKFTLLIFISFISVNSFSQAKIATPSKPKLVVGLVIDQMRWDFLYRFANRYSEGGFKRLQKKGYSFENTMIPYVPTVTAAGHTDRKSVV